MFALECRLQSAFGIVSGLTSRDRQSNSVGCGTSFPLNLLKAALFTPHQISPSLGHVAAKRTEAVVLKACCLSHLAAVFSLCGRRHIDVTSELPAFTTSICGCIF